MRSEITKVLRKQQLPPRLIVLFGGEVNVYPLEGTQSLGRTSKATAPSIAVPSRAVSRTHGEFLTDQGMTAYRDLGSTNGTTLNAKAVQPQMIQVLSDGDILKIHGKNDADRDLDVTMCFVTSYHPDSVWTSQALTDDIREVVIGRQAGIGLQDRSVSRKHASFFKASGGWAIIDHGSTNGVELNGKKLQSPEYLKPGDAVRISDYLFFFTGDRLLHQADAPGASPHDAVLPAEGQKPQKPYVPQGAPHDPHAPQQPHFIPQQEGRAHQQGAAEREILSIWIEERNVWNRAVKKTLLKDIRMEIPSGSMVLVLGGSGAGKTTFVNAVMGYEPAQGQIRYKGIDIYEEYEQMKYEIGYVPQQDLLRMSDVVYDTIMNAAQMRLPSRLSQAEREERVEKTIRLLGLDRVRDSLVGKLSGGQRKRLSIAVEYIGDPSLFFLDEPDSGLDGVMARALMENLRQIADDNRIVIVISHSPDRAFELWDRVVVLAKDSRDDSGHLVYFGSPKDACAFFDAESLEQVVRRINNTDEGGDGLADHYIRKYEQAQRR